MNRTHARRPSAKPSSKQPFFKQGAATKNTQAFFPTVQRMAEPTQMPEEEDPQIQMQVGESTVQTMTEEEEEVAQTQALPATTVQRKCAACEQEQPQSTLQTKLTVGQPGDQYEQEADRVADQVVSQMATPQSPRVQPQRLTTPPHITPLVMRQGEGKTTAPPQTTQQLQQTQGQGQPLDRTTRSSMEQAFGADFSNVRVHADNNAHQLNQSLSARAFTNGQDIYFRQGEYQPGSQGGQKLLAHELTHVMQQSGNSPELVQRQERGAASDLEERLGSLIPESGRSMGPVESGTVEQARAYLAVARQTISDVHRDINSLLQLVHEIEGLVSEDVFNSDLLLTVLYEGLDAAAVAVPEAAEAATTVIGKTIKVIVMTVVRVHQAQAANRRTQGRINEISGLLEALVEAQIAIDELNNRVDQDPDLASLLASQPIPAVPRRVARSISKEVELRLLVAMVRRAGGIETEETDRVMIPRGETFTATEVHQEAIRRHRDPLDNFYLRCPHSVREFSTMRAISGFSANAGVTDNMIHSWYYYVLDVDDTIAQAVLRRLQRIGVTKERFFTLTLGPLLRYRCG